MTRGPAAFFSFNSLKNPNTNPVTSFYRTAASSNNTKMLSGTAKMRRTALLLLILMTLVAFLSLHFLWKNNTNQIIKISSSSSSPSPSFVDCGSGLGVFAANQQICDAVTAMDPNDPDVKLRTRMMSPERLQSCISDHSSSSSYLSGSPISIYRSSDADNHPLACHARGDVVCRWIGQEGHWESVLADILDLAILETRKLSSADVTYFDIGGNVGAIAFHIAAKGIRTEVFEMMPRNVGLLTLSKCLNPTFPIHIHHSGLSEKTSSCRMVSKPENVGDASLECDKKSYDIAIHKNGYVDRGLVPLKSLDELYPTLTSPFPFPSVVKIDVEGHEIHVALGAKKNVFVGPRRPHVILSEVWKINFDLVRFVSVMRSCGYRARDALERVGTSFGWLDSDESAAAFHEAMGQNGRADIQNLLFVRDDVPELEQFGLQ
eukprot:PhM_4_TR12547/c0_g1_i1/m.58351